LVLICSGYYSLKDYEHAISACSKAIEDQRDNLQARFLRGVAYQNSGRIDAALSDLAIVAGSESNFRASAAITMSMIFFNRNNDKDALDVLNKYTYLYDPITTSKDDVAVAYNNRCYAYMQLGEMRKALDDCTESLKYGSIPDAFRKQQELMKRLERT
jgi:tetratricopeptide (TPR) repeat protein